MPTFRLVAGATTLLLCAQYLVAEAIAAAAWTQPYSYSRNFISDLGITTCVGNAPCSPLGVVMNAGFIVSGGLAILSAALLLPLIRGPLSRALVMLLATTHGAGSAIVGWVHSAPGTAAGTPHLHVLGAYAAILGGNLTLIAVGLRVSSRWAALSFRLGSLGLGLFGLGSGLALVLTRTIPPGLLERGAVDTITVWEVGAGLLLVLVLRREPRAPSRAARTA